MYTVGHWIDGKVANSTSGRSGVIFDPATGELIDLDLPYGVVAPFVAAAGSTDGVCGLRLYVDHHNAAARETYLRVGMKDAGYTVFEVDFSAVAR